MSRTNQCSTSGWGFAFVRPLLAVAAGILALTFFAVPNAQGQDEPVIRIEEDWLLILNYPDPDIDSPQFHTVMSPFANLDSYYAEVVWNYREIPDFLPGGLQLESWNGEQLVRSRTVRETQLSTTAETIRWTQALQTDGTILTFDITNGLSTTWGIFGKDMNITADASLLDLSTYSADVSAQNACVTYGANRVNLLAIVQVRCYGASGLLSVDRTPRIVFNLATDLGVDGAP